MMTKADAERIADTAVAIRPDWIRASIITILHNHRAKNPRDVHLAMTWLAYDPDTRTPARINETGPWWTLGREPGTPQLPSFRDRWRHEPKTTPATPETIAAMRQRLRERTPHND